MPVKEKLSDWVGRKDQTKSNVQNNNDGWKDQSMGGHTFEPVQDRSFKAWNCPNHEDQGAEDDQANHGGKGGEKFPKEPNCRPEKREADQQLWYGSDKIS